MPSSTQLTYKSQFQQPTGLHPKLEIALSRQLLSPPKTSCSLHAYMTLPSAFFIDRYQLSDQLFLDSQNLVALRSLTGEDDLEAPDWTVERWGSAALFELATPRAHDLSVAAKDKWTITIPTHLRYVRGPNQEDDKASEATVAVPWPVVFWACDAEEGLKMASNPFDRVNLGYDGLFGPKTMFYHVPPVADAKELVHEIHVPVLNVQSAASVQMGTLIAVTAGFAWVCWQLVKSKTRWSSGGSHVKKE